MNVQEVMGVVRAVLSGVGGILVTKGFLGSSDVEIVVGAVVSVATVVWSVLQKRGTTPA
jgi:hypothetical protein